MNIVFLTGEYLPKPYATGVCVRSCAQAIKDEHAITVICLENNSDDDYSLSENYCIRSVSTPYRRFRNAIEHKLDAEGSCVKKAVFGMCLMLLRLCNYSRVFLSKTYRDKRLTEEYLHALESLTSDPDLIIASCSPFEGVYAAMRYKTLNADTRLVPFLFDQYADAVGIYKSEIQKKAKFKWCLREEAEVFDAADSILHITWDEHIKNHFHAIEKKFIKVEHPFPYVQPWITMQEKDIGIHSGVRIPTMVYAGSLTSYVSPEDVLRMYSVTDKGLPDLCFYSAGPETVSVDRYSKTDKRVSLHSWVGQEELPEVLSNADICLSIAEKRGLQISSKIFQYIRLGKPILHIYYNSQDVNIPYLQRYPLALCVQVDSLKKKSAVDVVADWLMDIRKMSISQKEIDALYPDLLASNIMKVALAGAFADDERFESDFKHD